MQVRNVQYNSGGTIDLEIEHPAHGWVPFTAAPDDSEQLGRDLFAAHQETALPYVPPPPPPEPTPAELRMKAWVELAAYRWQKEIGGVVWETYPVHTDERAQVKLAAEMIAIQGGFRADPSGWKFADGVFRSLTNMQFIDMVTAVRNYIGACFMCEAMVAQRIANDEYDVPTLWNEEWATLTAV